MSEPKLSGQSEAEASYRPRRPCNFEEDGDEPGWQDDYGEVYKNDQEGLA